MTYELFYHENIKLIMGLDDLSIFIHFFNKHHLENIHLKSNNKTYFLSNDYYENLISTFFMMNQYLEIMQNKSSYFANPKAAFLALLYFHVYQETSLIRFKKEFIEYVKEDLDELVSAVLIKPQDVIVTARILDCLADPDVIISRDTGEHIAAELVRDILRITCPSMISRNSELIGVLFYYSNISELKGKTLSEHRMDNKCIIESLYHASEYVNHPYMKRYFDNKVKILETNFIQGNINVK